MDRKIDGARGIDRDSRAFHSKEFHIVKNLRHYNKIRNLSKEQKRYNEGSGVGGCKSDLMGARLEL